VSRRGPGALEGEILTALWAAEEPQTAAQVQAGVGGDLADTTVMTTLTRLMRKGLVVRTRAEGARVYRYAPVVGRDDHAAEQMYAALGAGEDHQAVLARFISRLSAADRRAVAELLSRRRS